MVMDLVHHSLQGLGYSDYLVSFELFLVLIRYYYRVLNLGPLIQFLFCKFFENYVLIHQLHSFFLPSFGLRKTEFHYVQQSDPSCIRMLWLLLVLLF